MQNFCTSKNLGAKNVQQKILRRKFREKFSTQNIRNKSKKSKKVEDKKQNIKKLKTKIKHIKKNRKKEECEIGA